MTLTLELPDDLAAKLAVLNQETVNERLTEEEFTRRVMELASSVMAQVPGWSEEQILILVTSLENTLPQVWRNASDTTRGYYLFGAIVLLYLTGPEEFVKSLHSISQQLASSGLIARGPVEAPMPRRGLMRFATAGKGSPGSLPQGMDAQEYVNTLREEWSER
jgi:hypothetical protein